MKMRKAINMPRAKKTAEGRLPGDPSRDQLVAEMIRVDHAGEYGAVRIYAGQLAVLGRSHALSPTIRHMAAQEKRHLEKFDDLIFNRRVRPTALAPFWHMAGFALGAATALMGEKAALACTTAVEEVIEEHYAEQLARLGDDEADLKATIDKFRDEEIEHKNTAIDKGARDAPGYSLLSSVIKSGCRAAIMISKKI
jgi:ubiquinone biosynthesis monooxygenase Coq7